MFSAAGLVSRVPGAVIDAATLDFYPWYLYSDFVRKYAVSVTATIVVPAQDEKSAYGLATRLSQDVKEVADKNFPSRGRRLEKSVNVNVVLAE